MKNKRIIIGLTGSFGSGCSTVADLLNKQGFQLLSISSILIREAAKKGIKLDKLLPEEKRSKLQDIGNELRKTDPGILIKKVLEAADLTKDIVINNIKNPGEIKELKRHYESYVIAIDTSFEKRVERILDNKYGGHKRQFVIDDDRERDEGISYGQRLQGCVDLADIIINNNDNTDTPKQKRSFKAKISSYIHLTK
jgi:dephospho-CoA kinase